jgi:hypothetical protein
LVEGCLFSICPGAVGAQKLLLVSDQRTDEDSRTGTPSRREQLSQRLPNVVQSAKAGGCRIIAMSALRSAQ